MINPARIAWRDDQPYNVSFADIYHAADGQNEVERVFLGPAGLTELARKHDRIYVAELGFGTGLNFAVTAQACLSAGCHLHFISFEAAPIEPDEFSALANKRARRQSVYASLARQYPPLIEGWHRRYFADGKITLSVYWGDAAAGLSDLIGRQRRPFHAWFLDGFDPRKNPALWKPALFKQIASLSAVDTTVATFTSAGHVRRGLIEAGFAMRRVDQRPHKRESLAGTFLSAGAGSTAPAAGSLPRAITKPDQVSVLGAGLAGASVARHLAELDINVCVYRAISIEAASTIPTMVLHGRLMGDESPEAALRCHAYLYSAAYCAGKPGVEVTGALQLPGPNMTPTKLARIASRYAATGTWLRQLDALEASDLAGWRVTDASLSFPASGIVDTPRLCDHLLTHPNIEVRPTEPLDDAPAFPCVLACGYQSRSFEVARFLEIAAVHGQLDFVTCASLPNMPLIGNGYLAPAGNSLAVGASYEYQPWSEVRATQINLERLRQVEYKWLGRARGVRCVSSDRTPIAGPLFAEDQSPLPGYYTSTGHGSMGTVTSHFAAAAVACQIIGECPPMTRELEGLMSSVRFRVRQARRGFRHGASGP